MVWKVNTNSFIVGIPLTTEMFWSDQKPGAFVLSPKLARRPPVAGDEIPCILFSLKKNSVYFVWKISFLLNFELENVFLLPHESTIAWNFIKYANHASVEYGNFLLTVNSIAEKKKKKIQKDNSNFKIGL